MPLEGISAGFSCPLQCFQMSTGSSRLMSFTRFWTNCSIPWFLPGSKTKLPWNLWSMKVHLMGVLVPEHSLCSLSAWITAKLLVVLIWVWWFPWRGQPLSWMLQIWHELHVGSPISDRQQLHKLPVRHQRIPADCILHLFSQHEEKVKVDNFSNRLKRLFS